jgi:hypothetical protein
MKIVIDNLQSQDLVSEIDPAAGRKIIGGDFIDSNVNIAALSDNAESRGSGRVFGLGSNLSGSLAVNAQTGKDFSLSSSLTSISSN